jgi:hypothetical protein
MRRQSISNRARLFVVALAAVAAVGGASTLGRALPVSSPPRRATTGALQVSPLSLSFAHQANNAPSAPMDVVLRAGTSRTPVSGVHIEGAQASSFQILSGGEAGTLAPSSTRTIKVVFAPKAGAPGHDASLVVTAGAGDDSAEHRVSLYGASADGAAPYYLQPTGDPAGSRAIWLRFNRTKLQVTSSPVSVTLRNIGSAEWRVEGISMGPSGLSNWQPQDFKIAHNGCSGVVRPGGTCLMSFTFRPTGVDRRIGQCTLTGNALEMFIKLEGTGFVE